MKTVGGCVQGIAGPSDHGRWWIAILCPGNRKFLVKMKFSDSGSLRATYDAALSGWLRVACDTLADGARKRTEVLWLNPRAAEQLDGRLAL